MTRKQRALENYAKHHSGTKRHVAYVWRDKLLKELGFDSYREYLSSATWRKIRARALKKNGGRCVSCDKRATQVHHSRYDRASLVGESLKHLYPVCRPCHKRAEVGVNGKRSIHEANASLGSISVDQMRYWHPGRRRKERSREKNRQTRLIRQRRMRSGSA